MTRRRLGWLFVSICLCLLGSGGSAAATRAQGLQAGYSAVLERSSSVSDGQPVRIPIVLENDEEEWVKKIRRPYDRQNGTTDSPPDFTHPSKGTQVRPWRREHLSRGLLAFNHQQFRPMLERLNSGRAVNVIAYGSSITQDSAGCFHTGPVQTLAKRLGMDKLPDWHVHYGISGRDYDGRECFNSGGRPNWGNMLLQVINATWPHPGNTFINAGRAACSLKACVVEKGCIEAALPAHLELMILESYTATAGVDLERLVWRVFSYYQAQGKPRPAVMYIRTGFIADMGQSKEADACLRDADLCETTCGHGPFNHTLTAKVFREREEYDAAAVAQYYGFTFTSHRHFLASMMRDGVPKQLLADKAKAAALQAANDKSWGDMSTCRFLSAIHKDTIHTDPIGNLLLVDYVLDALASAQDFLASARGLDAASAPLLPNEPLYDNGHELSAIKCTTIVDARSSSAAAALKPGSATVLVLAADKWQFSAYQVHGTVRKYKPGWIAVQPGAVMRMALSTVFPELTEFHKRPGQPKDTNATMVAVSFLESYEHMGMARVRCVSGCTCEPVIADAHNPAQHASVAQTVELTTYPPVADCTIEIEVLQETKSGEHKFKVLSVTARKGPQYWTD